MIIAEITVYACDGCNTTAVVAHEDDRASFEANWFGITTHWCPRCQVTTGYLNLIAEEECRVLEAKKCN